MDAREAGLSADAYDKAEKYIAHAVIRESSFPEVMENGIFHAFRRNKSSARANAANVSKPHCPFLSPYMETGL